ncbi:MAG TPA: tRNA (guanine(10)-N(2))-dimethyltransferase [Candidatus Thermoplasmatota archaeon]|nr:tRNA (guanine(10)-N(2))-dimethyltransferase [Candidatus Thermoplasmatota archaeon]
MSEGAPHVEVMEGRARLRLPAAERSLRGPESKDTAAVFYNPAMALNRDLSSLLVSTKAQDGWSALDGLAASGARGLRYALESGRALSVEFNDWNPMAARLIAENCAMNGVEPHVTQRNLAPLLYESVWHLVDIDPYGSPAPFLDAATRAVRDRGLLGITATDATALAGVYPNVCRRRYLATPMHNELMHEIALRILVAAGVRHAAKHEVALTPVLAHATDHYYRVMFAARRGASRADEALKHVGVAHYCPTCADRGFSDSEICPACGAPVDSAGPVWTAPLIDAATAQAMLAKAGEFPFAALDSPRILDLLAQEAGAPPLFFDIHEAGSRARMGSPRTERVWEALREQGFAAAPVHFNRLGVRTDASAKDFMRIVASLSG